MNKIEIIREAQDEANVAKEKLMRIVNNLYEAGATKQAKSLDAIIEKLEMWQNK